MCCFSYFHHERKYIELTLPQYEIPAFGMTWPDFINWTVERARQLDRVGQLKMWLQSGEIDMEFEVGACQFVAPKVVHVCACSNTLKGLSKVGGPKSSRRRRVSGFVPLCINERRQKMSFKDFLWLSIATQLRQPKPTQLPFYDFQLGWNSLRVQFEQQRMQTQHLKQLGAFHVYFGSVGFKANQRHTTLVTRRPV